MNNRDHPFDTSIPDPFDSEQMIVDAIHDTFSILEVPSMPDGNGAWYRPGLGPFSPDRFDANNQPLDRVIGKSSNTSAQLVRDMLWAEWVEAYRSGGEPMLTILEGQRQLQRMDKTGVAHAFKLTTDVCGGGKRLDDCGTAVPMIKAAKEIAANAEATYTSNEGRKWNTPPQLSRTCGSCALSCQVAYQTEGGTPTGITRFTTVRPLDDMDIIRIDLTGLQMARPKAVEEINLVNLEEISKRIQGPDQGEDRQ